MRAPRVSANAIRAFRRRVLNYYRRCGRRLPWRETDDPYQILVSEVMLQQTQVDRVISKFAAFVRRFPTFGALARAPAAEVLAAWQGLGYNRRALQLQRCATIVVDRFQGRLPDDETVLRRLPGIGSYTAGAIRVFAYRQPALLMETNIRAALIHAFFPHRRKVSDDELMPLVEQTLDRRDPRRWYDALMDYGNMLKRRYGNPARRSAQYVRPSRFQGSTRQLRGAMLRLILARGGMTIEELARACGQDLASVRTCARRMAAEGLIVIGSTGRCGLPAHAMDSPTHESS